MITIDVFDTNQDHTDHQLLLSEMLGYACGVRDVFAAAATESEIEDYLRDRYDDATDDDIRTVLDLMIEDDDGDSDD